MTATQTVTWAGKTYSFTTEGATSDAPIRIIGSIFNSRGEFRGQIIEDRTNGAAHRGLVKHNLPWMSPEDRAAALAAITA